MRALGHREARALDLVRVRRQELLLAPRPLEAFAREMLEASLAQYTRIALLGGEVRRVSRLDVRVAEAARLGFKRLLVPAVCFEEQKSRTKAREKGADPVCELVPIQEVAQAVDWLRENGMG